MVHARLAHDGRAHGRLRPRLPKLGLLTIAALILMCAFAGVAQASSVTNVTVADTPPSAAAGARTVYTVAFNTSATGGLSAAANSQITINFPAGTTLSTIVASTVTDTTSAKKVGFCFSSSTTTLTCALNSGQSIAAGDGVSIELDGVTNPPAGTVALTVSTTSDTTTSERATYTIGAAGQASQPTVAVSSPSGAAGARTIYTIGFNTSATGGAMSATANSQMTINFPAGTTLSTIIASTVTDTTSAKKVGFCFSSSTTTLTCALNSGQTIAAGDGVSIELDGVTNPPAGTVALTVSTTSDTTTSARTSYTIGAPGQASQPTVAFSSPSAAAGARTIYTIGFTLSSSGAMSATANSQFTINFPASTTLSTIIASTVTDTTTATKVGFCFSSSSTTLSCALSSGQSIAAGDGVSIELDGVTNPPAGTVSLTVSTTSDTTTSAATSYTIGAAGQASKPTVAFSSPTGAAGARTIYTIGFNTATPGGTLSATADSRITINFPAGTTLSTIIASTVTDTTTATKVGFCFSSSSTTLSCALNSSQSIAAGHGVSIELDGVTNPPAGTVSLTVSTTSDTTTSSATSYTIGAAGQVSQPTVTLNSLNPGAQGVTYTIAFATSSSGAMSATANSQFTIKFPTGTVLSTITSSTVTDTTTVTRVGFCFSSSTTTLTCALNSGQSIPAGHGVSIQLVGVTNPSSVSTSSTLTVATTSDTTSTTSSGYQPSGGPPPSPTVTGISPSSGPAAGGTSVTITGSNLNRATAVDFGPSGATNVNLVSATQITATSPPGSGTVDVTVTGPGGTSPTNAGDRFTYAAPAPPPPGPPPPPPASTPPVVSGGAPSGPTGTGATVAGTVNPESLATTAFFEYGLDPSFRGPGASTTLYDQSTPPQQIAAGSAPQPVSASLTGLVSGALYHVRLVATNSAGTTLGADQTFITAQAAAPPPPVLGKTENAQPVSGTVFIRTASGAFVRLTGAQQIPSGAVIDATRGTLKITTALPGAGGGAHDAAAKGKGKGKGKHAKPKSKTQSGNFGGAIFKITQARSGLTNLSLVEGAFKGAPSFALCKAHKAGDATIASSRTLQLLRASAHGKFRTKGRYSAATVRGTKWTVADRCDGTLTHDITHSVAVTDFVRHKTIILHAGQSYLAKARKP